MDLGIAWGLNKQRRGEWSKIEQNKAIVSYRDLEAFVTLLCYWKLKQWGSAIRCPYWPELRCRLSPRRKSGRCLKNSSSHEGNSWRGLKGEQYSLPILSIRWENKSFSPQLRSGPCSTMSTILGCTDCLSKVAIHPNFYNYPLKNIKGRYTSSTSSWPCGGHPTYVGRRYCYQFSPPLFHPNEVFGKKKRSLEFEKRCKSLPIHGDKGRTFLHQQIGLKNKWRSLLGEGSKR